MIRRCVYGIVAVALGLTLILPTPAHLAGAKPARMLGSLGPTLQNRMASCNASLTLQLQPGQHFPGGQATAIPADLPPGPLALSLPLYPGATATGEVQKMPSFSVPAVDYLKSASATYRADAGIDAVQGWYQQKIPACGFTASGMQTSGDREGQLSQGISFTKKQGNDTLDVSLSFAASRNGGTLILYVAIAITPPAYPVAGSPLRVPGTPIAVTITRYSGMNPGPHALTPIESVSVDDAATAAALANEINHLPKPLGIVFCPMDDGSHDSLLFRDADGTTHAVRVGLRGCQYVVADGAPNGRLGDDPALLPRINALLRQAKHLPRPFDARSMHATGAQRLAGPSSVFLTAGQSGTHLLYVAHDDLFVRASPTATPKQLASGIADAGFTINDSQALARPSNSNDLQHLRLIDTATGTQRPFALPRGATLVGRVSGTGMTRLSDAMACNQGYVWYLRNGRLGAIDPTHPGDSILTRPFAGPLSNAARLAVSCNGVYVAVYQPGHGLLVRNPGMQSGPAPIVRHVSTRDLRFLAWAPDERHLAFGADGTVSVLDVHTGSVHALARLGNQTVSGATWDPWSHVLALSMHGANSAGEDAHILLVNADGSGQRTLPLPFSGASRLMWSGWRGTVLGVTRVTLDGDEAWAVTLPGLPADPADQLPG